MVVIFMKRQLTKMIDIYQKMPLHTHSLCRFYPTCSEYMKQSVIKYGTFKGGFMGIKRLLKCHPFGKYGYDPVPEYKEVK